MCIIYTKYDAIFTTLPGIEFTHNPEQKKVQEIGTQNIQMHYAHMMRTNSRHMDIPI